MRRWVLVVLLGFAACSGGEGEHATPPVPPPVPAQPAPPPPPAPVEIVPLSLPADANAALLDPSKATEKAPDEFKVRFETTKGPVVIAVHRAWAPNGADRFYNLVKIGFYDNTKFFRAISGFMVQFGISGYPEVSKHWSEANLQDDPVTQSNVRGRITFATAGPNTRTTQLFINLVDNANLDGMGFAPFGEVVEGMDLVNQLYTGYGEGAPMGRGPSQGAVQEVGNAYLEAKFPKLDGTVKATLVE